MKPFYILTVSSPQIYLLNPHGSDETAKFSFTSHLYSDFLTHTVQMKLMFPIDGRIEENTS